MSGSSRSPARKRFRSELRSYFLARVPLGVLFLDRPYRGRGGEQPVDAVLFDDPPERSRIRGSDGLSFVQHCGGTRDERRVADDALGFAGAQSVPLARRRTTQLWAIADRLNPDLVTNPPPTPVDPARAVGQWTYSNVRDMLTNPKHTGHMVWNRRARKGNGRNRANPVSEWVWSPEPVHEPLVDLESFVQAQQVAARRERSRSAAGRNRSPQSKRIYRLRGYLFCALCNRRMYGKTKRGIAYYVCAAKKVYLPLGHLLSAYWIREDYFSMG